ncbi:hypothetical protein M426DRAFT_16541 [Hypoxylon sp. CI-4A]|nr:hypothetical protein M426DRAFT_16541 [Hypoxylon sp. CI-4A]
MKTVFQLSGDVSSVTKRLSALVPKNKNEQSKTVSALKHIRLFVNDEAHESPEDPPSKRQMMYFIETLVNVFAMTDNLEQLTLSTPRQSFDCSHVRKLAFGISRNLTELAELTLVHGYKVRHGMLSEPSMAQTLLFMIPSLTKVCIYQNKFVTYVGRRNGLGYEIVAQEQTSEHISSWETRGLNTDVETLFSRSFALTR